MCARVCACVYISVSFVSAGENAGLACFSEGLENICGLFADMGKCQNMFGEDMYIRFHLSEGVSKV